MRDRLADVGHRQRLPGARLEQVGERAVRTSDWPSINTRTCSIGLPTYAGRGIAAAMPGGARRLRCGDDRRRPAAEMADRAGTGASEPVADPEVERERAVAVLRDDPAKPIVLIVFEDDDLLALACVPSARAKVR